MAEFVHAGPIEQTASATRGRIIEIVLSTSGHARLKAAQRIVFAIENKMLGRFGSQRRDLAGLLQKCIDAIVK